MSMLDVSPAYRSVTFDREELQAIRTACTAAVAKAEASLEGATGAGIEEFAELVSELNKALTAGSLIALFKPGQAVRIEEEDLEPLLDVLRSGCAGTTRELRDALRRALARIDSTLAPTGAGTPLPRKR